MARQKKPSDAVQFTRESAERIAGVVRAAELSQPIGSPLSFRPAAVYNAPAFRVTSFTGVWSKGMVKMFTVGQPPNTTSYGVMNYFATVGTANTNVQTVAAFGRVPNPSTLINWVLIAAECNS